MNLFTKPINEISYDDVVSFCEQEIAEGVNLDYKQDFPEKNIKLAKSICAFANTFGGIIVIGVVDEDSKPKAPFLGIDHKEKLEEKVWNIILDNIYPPVFPEIRICPAKDNKTFVVIRIPQSNETPHAIYNNTQVCIRTGNRNKPEDLATVAQIEWLLNRRKKSEELRETLYHRVEERYSTICEQKKIRFANGEIIFSSAPLYPQKPLFAVEEIESIMEKIKNSGILKFSHYKAQPIQDGIVHFNTYPDKDKNFIHNYTEINKFGLIHHKAIIIRENELNISYIYNVLNKFLMQISNFYEIVSYWGLLEIKLTLTGILGVDVIYDFNVTKEQWAFRNVFQIKKKNDIEKILSWSLVTTVSELNDTFFKQYIMLELIQDITWSLGISKSKEEIKVDLKKQDIWVGEEEKQ